MLDLIHSFVNIFAGGRSEIRVFLFIFYLIFLGLIYLIFKKKTFPPLKWKYFGLTVLCMYAYGFFLHIYIILLNGLYWADSIIVGNNGEISSSVLWHTHIAKGIFGQIFYFFGKTKMATMDAGGAYLGFFPKYVFLFGSILFIIIVIQAIIYFITSFKLLLADKNKRQKLLLILIYAIISFSLIKTSIDGGFLNYSFLINLIFIGLFVFYLKGKLLKKYYYYFTTLGVVLLFVGLYYSHFSTGYSLSMAYGATLIFLYLIIFYASECKIKIDFLILLIVLFISGWYVSSGRDRDILSYAKIIIPNEQTIVTYSEKNNEVEINKNEHIETIGRLTKEQGKNVTYTPIMLPGITCMGRAPQKEFNLNLISYKKIIQNSFTSSQFIKITNESSAKSGNHWQTRLSVLVNPCVPEELSVLNGELLKNNINTYLLVNPLFYDFSND
ncbi:MAG: hypothetical protein WCI93_02075 [bacterium]